MIPETKFDMKLEIQIQPSKTYKLDPVNKRIYGFTDGKEAITQAIHKCLQTERCSCLIYSILYGCEVERFIGKDMSFVLAEIERTIKDALSVDDRVIEVMDFHYEMPEKDSLSIQFNVRSLYGQVKIESEVRL